MKKEKKIYYFCRRGAGTHIQFYTGWVKYAKSKGLPIQLITTVSFKEYLHLDQKLRNKLYIFIPCWKILDFFVLFCFFLIQTLRNELLVIHIRKRNTDIFRILKSRTILTAMKTLMNCFLRRV